MKPRLLDLFCGAGGAGVGYERAGFNVVGIDLNPQPNYPFGFIKMDALNAAEMLHAFDAVHASRSSALERIWFSPHCLTADGQLDMFGGAA